LLKGGVSGEREVSLKTGEQIFKALEKNEKYDIRQYDPRDDLKKFTKDCLNGEIDLVFPALHGPLGEDGKMQGMLDVLGVPYDFSGCLASALAMNKAKTKLVVEKAEVPVVKQVTLHRGQEYQTEKLVEELLLPIVIKPVELGSSVGMSIAKTDEELQAGLKLAFEYDQEVILEQFIPGRELTVTMLTRQGLPEALPVIEIIPEKTEWFDYRAKYEPGATKEVCPAEIPDNVRDRVQELALKAFRALDCKDLARADFIWKEDTKEIFFLEINTIPGMTATSLAPQAAAAAGMEFPQFLEHLIEEAQRRQTINQKSSQVNAN
jgi:D-alanine-D-alanine ligase